MEETGACLDREEIKSIGKSENICVEWPIELLITIQRLTIGFSVHQVLTAEWIKD